jgi:hypothetical protein
MECLEGMQLSLQNRHPEVSFRRSQRSMKISSYTHNDLLTTVDYVMIYSEAIYKLERVPSGHEETAAWLSPSRQSTAGEIIRLIPPMILSKYDHLEPEWCDMYHMILLLWRLLSSVWCLSPFRNGYCISKIQISWEDSPWFPQSFFPFRSQYCKCGQARCCYLFACNVISLTVW